MLLISFSRNGPSFPWFKGIVNCESSTGLLLGGCAELAVLI